MKTFLSSLMLYLAAMGFILTWWMIAFNAQALHPSADLKSEFSALSLPTSTLFHSLSPLQRERLHQALAGDFSLMLELIASWDCDAQILLAKGVKNIHRLSSEKYLQAHLLSHLIQETSSASLQAFNRRLRVNWAKDDAGHFIKLEDAFTRFLPQTYVAASFLLAIAKPHEIIALPKGLYDLPQLYPTEILDRVPNKMDLYQGEKLYLAHPHLAFIAPYSHPSTLERLRNQGIQLYTIKNIDTLADIQESLIKVGHASNHPIEANLLALFIEASLLAIDNRFRALEELLYQPGDFKNVLYLSYHHQYMMPTTKCLTGQLLQRALALHTHLSCPIQDSQTEWRVPFDQEKIIHANPDCLIFSISQPMSDFKAWMENYQNLQELAAFRSQRVFYVDETVQESPTQYIVLAYFDLFQALASAHHL